MQFQTTFTCFTEAFCAFVHYLSHVFTVITSLKWRINLCPFLSYLPTDENRVSFSQLSLPVRFGIT